MADNLWILMVFFIFIIETIYHLLVIFIHMFTSIIMIIFLLAILVRKNARTSLLQISLLIVHKYREDILVWLRQRKWTRLSKICNIEIRYQVSSISELRCGDLLRCQDRWRWTLFHFLFLFLFYFSFLFLFLFSIFRTTRVRVYQSRCHISHKLMA